MHRSLLGLLMVSALAAAETPDFIRVPIVATAPVIDGTLDDPGWQRAAVFTGMRLITGWPLAPRGMQSSVRMLCDGQRICLAVQATLPPGGFPQAQCSRHEDAAIYDEDHIEWQMLPQSDRALAQQPGHGFYKLAINALGALIDQRFDPAEPGSEDLWTSGATAASSIVAGMWTLEVALPLAGMGPGGGGWRSMGHARDPRWRQCPWLHRLGRRHLAGVDAFSRGRLRR